MNNIIRELVHSRKPRPIETDVEAYKHTQREIEHNKKFPNVKQRKRLRVSKPIHTPQVKGKRYRRSKEV